MMPQSPSKYAPWDLPQFSQSPSAAPLYFPESRRWSEISSLSKVIESLGKRQKSQSTKSGLVGGLSHLGDVMFLPKHCTKRDAWAHVLLWWSCQSPIAHSLAFWIILILSTEECISFMQNLMQIHCSTHSVMLNVTATQYTCSPNDICCPHWLIQWNHHCSHMRILAHSPWLPAYIDVTQTVLIRVTMAGLFPGWSWCKL